MQIPTNANITVIPTDDLDPTALRPATDADGQPRLVDGKPVYPLRGVVVKVNGQTAEGATVKVRQVPSVVVPELTRATLKGDIRITPWLPDGGRRIRYSILADGVETGKERA